MNSRQQKKCRRTLVERVPFAIRRRSPGTDCRDEADSKHATNQMQQLTGLLCRFAVGFGHFTNAITIPSYTIRL